MKPAKFRRAAVGKQWSLGYKLEGPRFAHAGKHIMRPRAHYNGKDAIIALERSIAGILRDLERKPDSEKLRGLLADKIARLTRLQNGESVTS